MITKAVHCDTSQGSIICLCLFHMHVRSIHLHLQLYTKSCLLSFDYTFSFLQDGEKVCILSFDYTFSFLQDGEKVCIDESSFCLNGTCFFYLSFSFV